MQAKPAPASVKLYFCSHNSLPGFYHSHAAITPGEPQLPVSIATSICELQPQEGGQEGCCSGVSLCGEETLFLRPVGKPMVLERDALFPFLATSSPSSKDHVVMMGVWVRTSS